MSKNLSIESELFPNTFFQKFCRKDKIAKIKDWNSLINYKRMRKQVKKYKEILYVINKILFQI